MGHEYFWKLLLNQDWFAIILTFFILNICVVFPPLFRKNKITLIFMLIVSNIRCLLIIINVYISYLPGSDKDAVRFVRNANNIANGYLVPDSFVGADLYEYYLSIIVKFVSDNPIYLHLSSNVIFIGFLYILVLLLNDMKIEDKYILYALAIINLFPSILLNTVTVLREPYQMFFIMLSIFSIYQYMNKNKIVYLFLFIMASFLLGISHNGLVIFIPILILMASITILWIKKTTIKSVIFNLILLILIFIVIFLMKIGILTSQATDSIISGKGLEYAEGYRLSSPDSRASYEGALDTSNIITIFNSSIILFIKYMIFPLPWMVNKIIDLISIFENLLRLIMITYILKYKIGEKLLFSFFLIYLIMEFVWSIGTSNWGTASRHHIISIPILVIVFVYVISKSEEHR